MTTHSKGNSVTKTVSMDLKMGADADVRAKALGFRSFSAYVQHLLRNDLMEGGDLTLKESPKGDGGNALAVVGARELTKYPPLQNRGSGRKTRG